MTSSKEITIAQYIKDMPASRRAEVKVVRAVIRKNIGKGFVEVMRRGMITYEIPLKTYPITYNNEPLFYAALANNKNEIALHLMCAYMSPEILRDLEAAFEAIDKKPRMGKSCIRFKSSEDIPLKAIGKIIKRVTLKKFIRAYEGVKGK